jgi:hypothetical protein
LEDLTDGDYDDWLWPVWVMPDCGKPQVGVFTDDVDGNEDPEIAGSGGPPNPVKFTVHRLDPIPAGELTVDFHSLAGDAAVGFDKDYQLFVKRDSGETLITPDDQRRFSLTFQDQETALEVVAKPVDNGVHQPTRSIFGMLAAGATYSVMSFLTNAMLVKDNELVPNLRVDSNNDGAVDDADEKVESKPTTFGAVVAVNSNDSNGDGTRDYDQAGPLPADPDLHRVQLDVPQRAGAQGKMRLSLEEMTLAQSIRVWEHQDKRGAPIIGPAIGGTPGAAFVEWNLGQQPAEVWVEGVTATTVRGDVQLVLKYTPTNQADKAQSDRVRLSTARSDPVVVGFYGADTWIGGPNWGNNLMTGIGTTLINQGFDQKTYWSRQHPKAFKELLAKLDYNKDGKYEPGRGDAKRDVRIYGHSWGGLSAILLSQRIQKADTKFVDDSVDILATIDPVYFGRTGKDYAGGVQNNVRYFWNRYASKTKRDAAIPIPLPIPGLWHIYPHGREVPSQALNNPPSADQIDRNHTGLEPMSPTDSRIVNHFLIIELERAHLINLITKNGGPF